MMSLRAPTRSVNARTPARAVRANAKQVAYLVNNGWIPCVEFAAPTEGFAIGGNAASVLGPGYYDNRYWTMYKLPMYGCTNPEQVLQEINNCKRENPGCFVRLLGFDNVRQ